MDVSGAASHEEGLLRTGRRMSGWAYWCAAVLFPVRLEYLISNLNGVTIGPEIIKAAVPDQRIQIFRKYMKFYHWAKYLFLPLIFLPLGIAQYTDGKTDYPQRQPFFYLFVVLSAPMLVVLLVELYLYLYIWRPLCRVWNLAPMFLIDETSGESDNEFYVYRLRQQVAVHVRYEDNELWAYLSRRAELNFMVYNRVWFCLTQWGLWRKICFSPGCASSLAQSLAVWTGVVITSTSQCATLLACAIIPAILGALVCLICCSGLVCRCLGCQTETCADCCRGCDCNKDHRQRVLEQIREKLKNENQGAV